MTWKSGSATITGGNSYVDIPHALGYTPDVNDIYVTPQDDLGGRSFSVPPDKVGSSTFRIKLSTRDLPEKDHTFSWHILTTGITPDSVRDPINLTVADIPDSKVIQFIVEATAQIELRTGRTIDYTNCTVAEATAIKLLARLYCLCHVTGGSAAGMNLTIGDLRVDVLGRDIPPLEVMQSQLEKMIEKLFEVYVGRV